MYSKLTPGLYSQAGSGVSKITYDAEGKTTTTKKTGNEDAHSSFHAPKGVNPQIVQSALNSTFATLHADCIRDIPKISNTTQRQGACVTSLVFDGPNKCYTANVGDSCSFICTIDSEGKVELIPVSKIHSPGSIEERARLKASYARVYTTILIAGQTEEVKVHEIAAFIKSLKDSGLQEEDIRNNYEAVGDKYWLSDTYVDKFAEHISKTKGKSIKASQRVFDRSGGSIAVSRSISSSSCYSGMSAIPDINVIDLECYFKAGKRVFALLCSDGMFYNSSMTVPLYAQFIERVFAYEQESKVTKLLISLAKVLGSTDDITCLFEELNPGVEESKGFVVADGHGGSAVAQYSTRRFAEIFLNNIIVEQAKALARIQELVANPFESLPSSVNENLSQTTLSHTTADTSRTKRRRTAALDESALISAISDAEKKGTGIGI